MSPWVWAWLFPCAVAYFILTRIRRWVRIDHIKEKYILITGCDMGFGHILAQRLDMLGCHVFAACTSESGKNRLQAVASDKLKAFIMDATNKDHVTSSVDYIRSSMPEDEGLWGLVNNSGIFGQVLGPPEWHSTEDFQYVLEMNTLSTVRVTLAFLPLLKKKKGRIVNLSSMLGRVAAPMALPYSMSKAALEIFSDGLRPHLAQYGVSVHILEPGAFRTELMEQRRIQKAIRKGWMDCPRALKDEFGEQYVDGLISTVEESLIQKASPDVNKVLKAYIHALTARCPRSRYTIGWDARLWLIPLCYAPSLIYDAVCHWFLKTFTPAVLKPEEEQKTAEAKKEE